MFDNVRRVFGQLVVYGSADVAILVVNVMLVPVYTRVLSPTDYGALALLLVLGAFLLPLTHLPRCGQGPLPSRDTRAP